MLGRQFNYLASSLTDGQAPTRRKMWYDFLGIPAEWIDFSIAHFSTHFKLHAVYENF